MAITSPRRAAVCRTSTRSRIRGAMRRAYTLTATCCLAALLAGRVSNVDFFFTRAVDAGSGYTPADASIGMRTGDEPVRFGVSNPMGGSDGCAASLASEMFRQALCTCDQLAPMGRLATKTFDSGNPSFIDDER